MDYIKTKDSPARVFLPILALSACMFGGVSMIHAPELVAVTV